MIMTSAVVTQSDFERLSNVLLYPVSRSLGPMTRLQDALRRCRIVASNRVDNDTVTMNTKVRVCDIATGNLETYTLVYPHDADIEENRISVLAPLGAALLGAKVHQVVDFPTPRGVRKVKIKRILYQPEAAGEFHL